MVGCGVSGIRDRLLLGELRVVMMLIWLMMRMTKGLAMMTWLLILSSVCRVFWSSLRPTVPHY